MGPTPARTGQLLRGLVLILLLPACGPREPRPTAAAIATLEVAAPADKVLLPAEVGPLPADLPLPPLPPTRPGLVAGDELGAMLRERTVFKIEADLGVLERVDAEGAGRLRAELAADPRWRVTRWEGQAVAFLRQRQGNGWSSGWGGFHRGPDEVFRVALYLEGSPGWDETIRLNAATARPLVVGSWPMRAGPFEGMKAALLAVKGPVLSLEVHELARDLQLSRTAAALVDLPVRLEEVARGIPARRTAPEGGDALQVERLPDGSLDLRGWLNPGAPGLSWLRIVGSDGKAWQEALVLQATLEEIGHSADPAQRFLLQGALPLVGTLPEGARLQAWFQPEGGGPARKLTEAAIAPQ